MDLPINPTQALFDGMSAAWQKERATKQMTLGALIKALEGITDRGRTIVGLGRTMSYRGYYSDLAFEPSEKPLTITQALDLAKGCMGLMFTGYKGGDFQMGEGTPIWSASYGDCGPRIMSLRIDTDPITLELKEEDHDA